MSASKMCPSYPLAGYRTNRPVRESEVVFVMAGAVGTQEVLSAVLFR